MRKIIYGLLLMLTFSSFTISQSVPITGVMEQSKASPQDILTDFTHTVFAEYATTTWCPNCPTASEALFKVYETGSYPFYFVSLVSDMNPNARNRTWYGYFNVVIPSVYFDGGYDFYIGHEGSVNATAAVYSGMIEEEASRTDVNDIDVETTVTWNGNAAMTIVITITNNEQRPYLGVLKSYVTEIESRWHNSEGNPYHFGFLDFAFNKPIFLGSQASKTITVQWDGNTDHDGLVFGDITKDNILVQTAVFHWIPHLTKGYDELPEFTQRFLGFFLDQSTAAFPQ